MMMVRVLLPILSLWAAMSQTDDLEYPPEYSTTQED